MSKQNAKKNTEPEQMEIVPIVDKYLIVKTLHDHIDESSDIAEYIGNNIHYGRALGYAEGKQAAYVELAKRILEGEFDPDVVMGDDHEYEM